VRQHEEGVRAGLLGDPREPQGLRPAVADAGDDGQAAVGDLDGGPDDRAVLVLVQREELAIPSRSRWTTASISALYRIS
jgi:hypothetical protein